MRFARFVFPLVLLLSNVILAQPVYKPAADLMRWSDRIGALEAGKWADIIAVPGDPLVDIKLLQHVPFVMKSGVVYKNEAHPDAIDKLPAVTAALPPTREQPTVNSF